MNLRDIMIADLRSRAVLSADPVGRLRLVDQMLEGAEFEDGVLIVTAPQWRDVITFLDSHHKDVPGRLAAVLAEALKSPGVWKDLSEAAKEWVDRKRAEVDEKAGAGSVDSRTKTERPTSVCVKPMGCGGHVTDWFDSGFMDDPKSRENQGRFFCVDCGLEWVLLDSSRCGYRDKAPRFGGHPDPSKGLPIAAREESR